MSGLAGSILLILAGFYLIFAYSFFVLPYLFYLLSQQPWSAKVMRTVSFALTPLLLPVGALLWISWKLLSILAGILVVFLFAWVAWLAWLNAHFPFGMVFKAWFKAAIWLLQKMQDLLELLGVKKLLFGIPVRSLAPLA